MTRFDFDRLFVTIPSDKLDRLVTLLREGAVLMEDEEVKAALSALGIGFRLSNTLLRQEATQIARMVHDPPPRCPHCNALQRRDAPPIAGCVRCDKLICSMCCATSFDYAVPGLCGDCYSLVQNRPKHA